MRWQESRQLVRPIESGRYWVALIRAGPERRAKNAAKARQFSDGLPTASITSTSVGSLRAFNSSPNCSSIAANRSGAGGGLPSREEGGVAADCEGFGIQVM